MPQNHSRRDLLRQTAPFLMAATIVVLTACGQTHTAPAGQTSSSPAAQASTSSTTQAPLQSSQDVTTMKTTEQEDARMWITVGGRRFAVTLSDSDAARAFEAQLPLTLEMSELNGNEKHAELPKALPADASRPGMIRNGDVMLYGTNTLVVFYSTFQSSYSYTRIGRVDEPSDLPEALGPRDVRVVFSKD